jgi:hydrogenase large subunit
MPTVTSIDPVSRLEGHLKINVTVDQVNGVQQVVDAQASGTMFRGLETILVNRPPTDAPDITQRVCGVCPVSHGMAAVEALESAAGLQVPDNARIMRNLVLGANFVQSHILHFYHLAALDYIDGPAMPPWQPSWSADKRIDAATTGVLVGHYVTALDMRRQAHEMGALFGGRLPHPPAFVPGGFTNSVRPDRIANFQTYLSILLPFIQNTYLPDVAALASFYPDYFKIGGGAGNLLAYGVFDLDASGVSKLLKRGRVTNSSRGGDDGEGGSRSSAGSVDPTQITEQVSYSWYANSSNNLPPSSGATTPQYPKNGAYSWLKAPRYQNVPYEVGPLARMTVNGDYTNGISVMDRHKARALEALKVAQALQTWVAQLNPSAPVYQQYSTPGQASGMGLTEAPRGALGHWVSINNRKIANYQIVTPTCWNASPKDGAGHRGPLEQAVIGTPIANMAQPVEVLRVIHSYDPCLSCAVHVMRPKEGVRIFALGAHPGV